MSDIYVPRRAQPVYTPGEGKMRVAFLFSGGGTGMITTYDPEHNPGYPNTGYEIVGGVTNKPGCNGAIYAEDNDIPLIEASFKGFKEANGGRYTDPDSMRSAYFDALMKELDDFKPDVVFLSGFMLIVPFNFVQEYRNRLMNVHPADLSIIEGPEGESRYFDRKSTSEVMDWMWYLGLMRKYTGDRAVRDALIGGEEKTCSTVHLVDEGVDAGPVIVRSEDFAISKKFREVAERAIGAGKEIPCCVEEHVKKMQNAMKYDGDGPAIREALELASEGRLGVEGETVFLWDKWAKEWTELPYGGIKLVE